MYKPSTSWFWTPVIKSVTLELLLVTPMTGCPSLQAIFTSSPSGSAIVKGMPASNSIAPSASVFFTNSRIVILENNPIEYSPRSPEVFTPISITAS